MNVVTAIIMDVTMATVLDTTVAVMTVVTYPQASHYTMLYHNNHHPHRRQYPIVSGKGEGQKGQYHSQIENLETLSKRVKRTREGNRYQKALRAQVAFEIRHLTLADQKVRDHGDCLTKQYGFVAEPLLTLWKHVHLCLGDMDVVVLRDHPCNATCHNLLRHSDLP